MENVLNEIHGRFIKLPEHEVRRNKEILESVVATFIAKMKTKDPLFEKMFRRVFYGGSFYDGLRVGKPEEFDLDLLLDIPKYAKPELTESDIPGFVQLQLHDYNGWMRQPEASPGYRKFYQLFDDEQFLCTDKALRWMESIIQRSMNDFPNQNGTRILQNEQGTFQIRFVKSGPALTLCINGAGMKMDIDLVTCFVFSNDQWPVHNFRSNPFPQSRPEFFIVPKSPKGCNGAFPKERYWRLSFQEQERDLLKQKERLKATVRLLKKLRDNENHTSIASYYIKTVVLHLLEQKERTFWNRPLNHVFMTVLTDYKRFIQDQDIPYYWNTRNNLIGKVDKRTLENINGRLATIIRDVDRHPENPRLIARYLLSSEEYRVFMNEENVTEVVQDENIQVGTKRYNEFIQNNQVVDERRHWLQPTEEPSMNWIREPTVITNEENRSTAETIGLVAGIIGGVAVAAFSAFKLFSDSRANSRNSD